MDKKGIIERAFNEGLLISPEALDMINEENLEEVIRIAKKNKTKNIRNLDFLKNPNKGGKETEQEIKINIKEPQEKRKLSPKDFVDFYNKKFENIKGILSKKTQAVSISNTKKSFSDVSVIGMIREINPQGFILEDLTGEIPVMSKEANLEEDDVIAVKGFVREGKIINGSIVFPDIPLNREIIKINANIVLTQKRTNTKSGFVFSTVDQQKGKNVYILEKNLTRIEIRKNSKKITVVMFEFPKEIGPEEATLWLKKRYLPDNKRITSPQNNHILTEAPDILWINSLSKWTKNYKGTLIISTTRNDTVRINLENKQIEFIDNI